MTLPMHSDALERTRLSVRHGPLVGPVLSRVVGIHAARAPLPMDRLQDALALADAIAAQAPAHTTGDRLPVSLRAGDGRLEIRVGPLRAGGAARVLEDTSMPDAGNVIRRLSDEVEIRPASSGAEYLLLTLAGAEPLGAGDPGA